MAETVSSVTRFLFSYNTKYVHTYVDFGCCTAVLFAHAWPPSQAFVASRAGRKKKKLLTQSVEAQMVVRKAEKQSKRECREREGRMDVCLSGYPFRTENLSFPTASY